MSITVAHLRAAGLTADQIVRVLEQERADQYERNRIKQRNYRQRKQRARYQNDVGDVTNVGDVTPPPPHTPLPSTDVASATSVSARKTTRRKAGTPIPQPWPWPIKVEDNAEFERFTANALKNDRRYVRWDWAWRDWQLSPYRKSNAGHPNGNGQHRESSVEQGKRLADEWRKREQEHGAGLFGTADDAGSSGSGGQDADGLPQHPRRSA